LGTIVTSEPKGICWKWECRRAQTSTPNRTHRLAKIHSGLMVLRMSNRISRDVCYWQIVLQKSFSTTDQKFAGLWMRFSIQYVRDLTA
jgi:hypothetical protein